MIREKSFGSMQSASNSKISSVNPISPPFHVSSSKKDFLTQIPQNYFSSSPPTKTNNKKDLKSYNTNNSGNVLTKIPMSSLPSKEYFKQGYIDVFDTNINNNHELSTSNKIIKNKNKKYIKKYNLSSFNDLNSYGIEKQKYIKEPQKLQKTIFHPQQLVQIQDDSSSSNNNNDEEAEKLLQFMTSQEYFLPKLEPNYKIISAESSLKNIFLENPRPKISYLPLVLKDQSNSEKLQLPSSSYTPTKSFLDHQRPQLQKPDPKVFYEQPINNSKSHYYPYHPRYYPYQQQHNRRQLEPEKFEFTEQDAVIPNPKIDIYENFNLKENESNPESLLVTPFRLIIDDLTTTEFSNDVLKTEMNKTKNVFRNNDLLDDHQNENNSNINDYCKNHCKNNNESEEFSPICGTDGLTYENEDHLNCMNKCKRSGKKF